MKNFLIDPNATNIPFCESPFFYNLVNSIGLTDEEKDIAFQMYQEGYVVLDLGLDDKFIERLKHQILSHGELKTQEDGYHYSDSPRVFEAWKFSPAVRDLACHPLVLKTLRMLYRREPIPFQTINFLKGSNQPAHSDVIHFSTVPPLWVAACWIALEDMDYYNGTLLYYPKSHKLGAYDFYNLNLKKPKYGEQFDNYRIYEEFIRHLLATSNVEQKRFIAKKGWALIWSSNLIHGGDKIRDPNRTRWSQATHYYFEGCDKYYAPMFSNASLGEFSEKDLSTKDIKGQFAIAP